MNPLDPASIPYGNFDELSIDISTQGLWSYDGSLPLNQLTWADVVDLVAFASQVACIR